MADRCWVGWFWRLIDWHHTLGSRESHITHWGAENAAAALVNPAITDHTLVCVSQCHTVTFNGAITYITDHRLNVAIPYFFVSKITDHIALCHTSTEQSHIYESLCIALVSRVKSKSTNCTSPIWSKGLQCYCMKCNDLVFHKSHMLISMVTSFAVVSDHTRTKYSWSCSQQAKHCWCWSHAFKGSLILLTGSKASLILITCSQSMVDPPDPCWQRIANPAHKEQSILDPAEKATIGLSWSQSLSDHKALTILITCSKSMADIAHRASVITCSQRVGRWSVRA